MMQRVVAMGCSGSGKSTFACRLGGLTGPSVEHLHRHLRRPGWTEPDSEAWTRKIMELAGASWIIDGNYGGMLDLRVTRADTVFCFDLSTAARTSGIVRRWLQGKLDWSFVHVVWSYRRQRRGRNLARLGDFVGIVVIFAQRRQAAAFLDRLRADPMLRPPCETGVAS